MGELLIGIGLILLSILIYVISGDLPSINESQLDAGSFPQFIAILLALLSLMLILSKARVLIGQKKLFSVTKLKEIFAEHKLVIITLGLLLAYIMFIQIIGFIIASILFIIVTAVLIGPKTKKDMIIISGFAVVFTLSFYFLFETVLKVRFPSGILF